MKFKNTSIKSWIRIKKVHRVIKFNQKARLKAYIGMNTELRKKKQKFILKKEFFKLMNNSVLGKIMENVRKNGDINLLTTKMFSENLLAIKMKKTK